MILPHSHQVKGGRSYSLCGCDHSHRGSLSNLCSACSILLDSERKPSRGYHSRCWRSYITPPNTLYRFWLVSPLEVIIFFIGIVVTVFLSIEDGICCTISISAAVLLFRVLKARGRFLGRVKVRSVIGDHIIKDDSGPEVFGEYVTFDSLGSPIPTRDIFIPIDHDDGSNPDVEVKNPYHGIFIYRLSEGFNYPNANHYLDHLTRHIFAHARRANLKTYPSLGDRPWNDPGPRPGQVTETLDDRAILKAIILDFNSVNNVDIISVQQLIDVRNQLDRYAAPDIVDWHFACINNRWTKRALVSASFGYPSEGNELQRRWKPIFSVAEISFCCQCRRGGCQWDEDPTSTQ